jgi:lipopolysaccharide export system permease protein
MFGTTIQRMVFIELMKVFSLALIALTGLFLIAGLIQEASQRGLTPSQILAAIPLLIPSTLPYTIPATTLFASCVVYGRLAHDNEVTAIRSSGICLWHILLPCIVLGGLTTIATLYLSFDIIPRTHELVKKQLLADVEEVVYAQLKRNRAFKPQNSKFVLYVREVQGRWLLDVIFKRRKVDKDGQLSIGFDDGKKQFIGAYDFVARSQRAKLKFDREAKKIVIDMVDRSVVWDANISGNLKDRIFEIHVPELFNNDVKPRPMDLSWWSLPNQIEKVGQDITEIEDKRNHERSKLMNCSDCDITDKKHMQAMIEKYNQDLIHPYRMYRALIAEQHNRPAVALGCMCFALIGCPVGIWGNRSDYLSTFIICFLPTVFVYYPLQLCGLNLAKDGKLPIAIGVWSANIIVGGIALWLCRRLVSR